MTREEAIEWFKQSPFYHNGHEPFIMAIQALKAVGEIKEIINISNFVIQEDVLKYKMICEVVERMDEVTE